MMHHYGIIIQMIYIIGYPLNFPTVINPNNIITNILGIQHTYDKPGTYIISITPRSNQHITALLSIIDTLFVHENDFYTWRQLKKVYSLGKLNWKSFSHMFCNATSLNQLPNQNLLHTNRNI